MRAIRELPLAASLLVCRGPPSSSAAAPRTARCRGSAARVLAASVALVATRGLPGGWPALVPLALLAGWLALSISLVVRCPTARGTTPNRALVYLLFAPLGLWLAGETRSFALGLMARPRRGCSPGRSSARCCRRVYDYGPPGVDAPAGPGRALEPARARSRVFALPLALWRRRLEGALLAYAALVALAPDLLARRPADGGARRSSRGSCSSRSGSRAARRSSRLRCPRPSSSGSRSRSRA